MLRPAVLLISRLLPEPEKLADMGIRIVVVIAVAFVAQRLLYIAVSRLEKFMVGAAHDVPAVAARARTIGQLLRRLVTTVVIVAAIIQSLSVLGWNVAPFLAGAGIVGVALGFGAQTLVRDLIAGLFILGENQFVVGDVIEVDGKPAAVEALSLRYTMLRDFNGYVHFVPNGEFKTVTNRSRGWTRLAVDAPVGADQSLERALEACRRVVEGMNLDPDWKSRLLDPVELWGVESLTGSEAQIRMVVRARPGADAPEAARELRLRVHRSLSETGIRTTHSREIAITPLPLAHATGASPRAGDPAPRGGKSGKTAAVGG